MEDGLVHDLYGEIMVGDDVLILVVVEDGLVRLIPIIMATVIVVLILVVVEDGLVPFEKAKVNFLKMSLNPCCSGRWSRTQ